MCGSCGKGGTTRGGFGRFKKGQKRVKGLTQKKTFEQLKRENEERAEKNAKSK